MIPFLVPKFTKQQIQDLLKKRKKAIEKAILMRLQLIGEQFVKNAREKANFKDRTGNLRNSIGYVILHDGRQVFQNFSEARIGASGKGKKGAKDEGPKKAQKAAREARKKFPTGYVLVGVAGMEYAAYVESNGYDVISSSAIQAEVSLKQAVRTIQDKVKMMKK